MCVQIWICFNLVTSVFPWDLCCSDGARSEIFSPSENANNFSDGSTWGDAYVWWLHRNHWLCSWQPHEGIFLALCCTATFFWLHPERLRFIESEWCDIHVESCWREFVCMKNNVNWEWKDSEKFVALAVTAHTLQPAKTFLFLSIAMTKSCAIYESAIDGHWKRL